MYFYTRNFINLTIIGDEVRLRLTVSVFFWNRIYDTAGVFP